MTDTADRSAQLRAAAFGVAFALAFALLCRLLPAEAFAEDGWRLLLYVIAMAAAPPTVWAVHQIAGTSAVPALEAGVVGAMTFDGFAIGFFPGVYGQEGDALVGLASVLLIAFMAVLAAGRLTRAPRG